jgi:hypothetical protein
LNARGQDHQRAISLYEWNAELCSAFYFPLQAVEVALRNVFNEQLGKVFGTDWPDTPSFLGIDVGIHKSVAGARAQALKRLKTKRGLKRPLQAGDIVAAFQFGFWTTLLSNHLVDSIWIPCLSKAFPEFVMGRKIAHTDATVIFNDIRDFRNRAFHHEPILKIDRSNQTMTGCWKLRLGCTLISKTGSTHAA